MSLEVKCDLGAAIQQLTAAKGVAKAVMPQLYQEFYRLTPVKTGNAKRNTKLVGNTIEADYPYAQVLDDGRSFRQGQMRGSAQAPQGMTKPTLALMNTLVQAQIAKANTKNG
jgi:hypothetical protein